MKRLLLSIGIVTAVLSVLLILRTRNRIEILATDDGMIVSAGAFSAPRELDDTLHSLGKSSGDVIRVDVSEVTSVKPFRDVLYWLSGRGVVCSRLRLPNGLTLQAYNGFCHMDHGLTIKDMKGGYEASN